MTPLEYRYQEPIIQPGYGQVYRDGEMFAVVYAQYASVRCLHSEHPEIAVDGVYQSDCPEVAAVGRDELVRGVRAVMAAYHDEQERLHEERERRDYERLKAAHKLPADVTVLFERYGGVRAIMADDLPSNRADEAEDPVGAQRLREYDL